MFENYIEIIVLSTRYGVRYVIKHLPRKVFVIFIVRGCDLGIANLK